MSKKDAEISDLQNKLTLETDAKKTFEVETQMLNQTIEELKAQLANGQFTGGVDITSSGNLGATAFE